MDTREAKEGSRVRRRVQRERAADLELVAINQSYTFRRFLSHLYSAFLDPVIVGFQLEKLIGIYLRQNLS